MDNSAGNVPKDCPKSYKFQGSTDGTNFEDILTVTDQDPCVADAILTKSFANQKSFKFYRFLVLDVPGRDTAKYVIMRDLRFFGNDDSIPCSTGNLATGMVSFQLCRNKSIQKVEPRIQIVCPPSYPQVEPQVPHLKSLLIPLRLRGLQAQPNHGIARKECLSQSATLFQRLRWLAPLAFCLVPTILRAMQFRIAPRTSMFLELTHLITQSYSSK